MTAGLYRSIRDDIKTLFLATWSHSDVPVYWRSDDTEPQPDPYVAAHFIRAQVDFGREEVRSFGNGPGRNGRVQFGSVMLVCFAARQLWSEDTLLDLLHDATESFRSKRAVGSYGTGSELSFIGPGSGFDAGPDEDGNWFMRGTSQVFEYRFTG